MNREKADALREELNEVIREWASKHNMTVTPQAGNFGSTSYTYRVTLNEVGSDGLAKQDAWDNEVMQNWLKGTGWEGRDPRGHVFVTATNSKKYRGHRFRIDNFKYGTRYPWHVTDLQTGEGVRCNNDFIDWSSLS